MPNDGSRAKRNDKGSSGSRSGRSSAAGGARGSRPGGGQRDGTRRGGSGPSAGGKKRAAKRSGGSDRNRRDDDRRRSGSPKGGPRGASGPGRGRRDAADDRSRPEARDRGGERRPDRDLAGPAQWGRIARRGAGNMDYDDPETIARREERKARPRPTSDETPPERARPQRPRPDADDLERAAQRAVRRGRTGDEPRDRRRLPARPHAVKDPAVVLRKLVGEQRAKTLNRKLNEAAKAFEAERYGDARTQLTPIVKEAPELPEGRELMGLTLYRLGKWKDAIEQLESFRELSGSTEQHPVLADCHRALGHWADVDALWEELGEASPSAELVVEGRIVVAGAKADQGDLTSAIRLLEQNWRPPKRPQGHHLRRAYALADLYDRAGRTPRARELFSWVAGHAPDLADVQARVRSLG